MQRQSSERVSCDVLDRLPAGACFVAAALATREETRPAAKLKGGKSYTVVVSERLENFLLSEGVTETRIV